MRKMKLFLFLSLFLAVSIAHQLPVQSQEAQQASSPALAPGAWALQFQIDRDFTLSEFQGAVISLKHHRSDRSAFRLGLGLNIDIRDIERSTFDQDTLRIHEERDDSQQSFRIDLQYIRYAHPTAPVKFLFGIGPLVSFSNGDTDRSISGSRIKYESTSWATGMSGLLGVEWFPTSMISFHAEYGMEFLYRKTSNSAETYNTVPSRTEETNHSGTFKARGVLFGLSAYF